MAKKSVVQRLEIRALRDGGAAEAARGLKATVQTWHGRPQGRCFSIVRDPFVERWIDAQ